VLFDGKIKDKRDKRDNINKYRCGRSCEIKKLKKGWGRRGGFIKGLKIIN
jgi:hypothetical protein